MALGCLAVDFDVPLRAQHRREHASEQEILGLVLPVPSLPDVLGGKVWTAQDPERRASKRQKDLAEIARLLERAPDLRSQVPEEILARLM